MFLLLFLSTGIYLASTVPVANLLLSSLESQYPVPALEDLRTTEAYVVLVGGTNDKALDIFGQGTLSSDSTARLVTAYRLYRISGKPIIISGGSARPSTLPEAEIGKRFLLKLGLRKDHIMVETGSRDTEENAAFTRDLCKGKGISKITLITSAYHLKRAVILFAPSFDKVVPCPADVKTPGDKLRVRDFFPDVSSLHNSSIALREHLGILFYKIKLWRKTSPRATGS